MDKNLALELVRVTEAAALSAAHFMGRGDKTGGDQAAVDGMRLVLNTIEMAGIIVIGEGEKDQAPMLYNGEKLGSGDLPEVDIAVDPIDGTRPLAEGRLNSISTVAIAPRGTMYDPGPFVYMDKIAVGPSAKGVIDLERPVKDNLSAIAKASGKRIQDLVVVMLERPRHEELKAEVRRCGARIRMIDDGDVAGALMTAVFDSGIDVLMGIGGTPEGVIVAAALRCTGGAIHCKPWPRDDDERKRYEAEGIDLNHVYKTEELVGGDDVFFSATGASTGELLRGVKTTGSIARTHSVVMRSRSGTIRWIETMHNMERLNKLAGM